MRVAIIGCGAMGNAHADAYHALGEEIVAVCDPDMRRAMELANRTGARPYTFLEELLASEHIDAASICTPAPGHLPAIEHLCHAGVAILCEKPFTVNEHQAIQAYKAVKASNVPFRLGFKMRYEAVYREARKILKSGELGSFCYAFISHFQPLSKPDWYMDVGVVTELLIHSIDMCCWLTGSVPERVEMRSEYQLSYSGEDKAFLQLEFSNGRRALIAGGYMPHFPPVRGRHDFVFQFLGEQGYVCGKRNSCVEVFSPRRVELIKLQEVNAFELEIQDFLDAVRGKQTGGATLEDALVSQRVLEAAMRSRQECCSVKIKEVEL